MAPTNNKTVHQTSFTPYYREQPRSTRIVFATHDLVLATEETTVTQEVSHRPINIKCQFRLWSQRGAKVNGSRHGDNPLLRPTGIQIATKSYATLQALAPTNIKTVHQTSLLHIIESNLDRLGFLKKNQNAPRPSEHPPVMGEKMSKRLGGIKGCKYKTSSWHLNRFPDADNIGSTV